mgnify:CR=1 FL=1
MNVSVLRYIFVFLVLCHPLVAQVSDTTQVERLQLVHADRLVGQNVGQDNVRQLIGNVKFRQGDAVLTCNRATQYVEAGRTILYGDVAYVDTAKSLYGDKITYYEATQIAYVEGNVKLVDSTKTLYADRLRYYDEEEKAVAEGNVVMIDDAEDMVLTGTFAEYLQESKYAQVTGQPVLTKQDTTDSSELVIRGSFFEMFDDGDRFVVTDSVHVTRGEIEAFCDTLIYLQEASKITLASLPRVHQGEQYLTGRSVSLLLDEADVVGIEISGNAIATSRVDSSIITNVPYDLLTGEDMMVYVTDENIDSVRIVGRATSYYHVIEEGKEEGLNKALGDTMFIVFQDQELRRVRVTSSPSASTGEFYPPSHQSTLEAELIEELKNVGVSVTESSNQGALQISHGRLANTKE